MAITLITNDKIQNAHLNGLLKDRFSYVGFHTSSDELSFDRILELYTVDILLFANDIKEMSMINSMIKNVLMNSSLKPKVVFLANDLAQTQKKATSICEDLIDLIDYYIIENSKESKIISRLMKLLSFNDKERKGAIEGDVNPVNARSMQQQVLDTMPMNFFWKDRHSVYQGCNLPFAKIAGISNPEEIIGETDYDMPWPKDEADFFVSCDRNIMESGNSEIGLVEPMSGTDGVEHWVETSKIPLRNDLQEIDGVIGAFLDVTEKVKLQEENIKKEKLNVLAQVAGGVAHDINNCLTIVLGFTDIALKGKMDPSKHMRAFERINLAGKKALQIGKKLMAFTKEEHTFMSILDLEEFFDSNIPIFNVGLKMNVDFEIADDIAKVIFDSSMLYQVLNNIIANAKQANEQEKKFVISMHQKHIESNEIENLKCGDYILIECRDFAGGMKDTVLENIFQPYFTTKSEGNGLGLASCKKIMEMQNGHIDATTELGVGTIFSLYIPVATVENSKKYIQFTKELVKGEGLILFSEDDPNLSLVNMDLIAEIGFTVIGYPSAEELLLDEANIEKACAVVTDFKFEDGMYNGLDLLNNLKSKRKNLPIILLSSYIDEVGAIEQFDYGLQKPLDIQKLSQVLAHLLNKRSF